MRRVRRFIYVNGPWSSIVHIKYGNTSEGPTACGRQAVKGWKYWKGHLWRRAGLRLCRQCDKES